MNEIYLLGKISKIYATHIICYQDKICCLKCYGRKFTLLKARPFLQGTW